MCKSRMMRSGTSSRALRNASAPSLASNTKCPDCSRMVRISSRPGDLSSATSTFFIRKVKGNRECEAASIAWLTLEPDPSAMLLDQPPSDSQSQPGAFGSPLSSGAYLIELVKNCLVLVLGNADPCVRNRNLCKTIAGSCLNPDLAAVRREFCSVG